MCVQHVLKVSTEKSTIMTIRQHPCRYITFSMNNQKVEEVTSFKYLGTTLYKDGPCSAETRCRIASEMIAMTKLNMTWQCNIISFPSKFKLCKFLVTSTLLYGWETRTLFAVSEKKDLDFQNQVPEETSPHLLLGAQDQQLGAEQNQLPRGSTGTSSGNCQEMETCMVRACHMPWQPLQNHPSRHPGGWAMLWTAEEMLDE